MKQEDRTLIKGKMTFQAGYKPKQALIDETGKNNLIKLIQQGAVCELKQVQQLDNGAETMTIKFYFKPT